MKWKRREKKTPEIIVRHVAPTITHKIEHMPRPKPVRMYGEVRNTFGEIWRLNPQTIYGQDVMPVNFPINFVTGDIKDSGKQAVIMFHLEY